MALQQVVGHGYFLHTTDIDLAPNSVLGHNEQLVWLFKSMVFVEEAVLVLLLRVVEVLLHVWNIRQNLVDGGANAQKDFLTHCFDSVLVIECH